MSDVSDRAGELLRTELVDPASATSHAVLRARLLDTAAAKRERGGRLRHWAMASTLVAAIALFAFFVLHGRSSTDLQFFVGPNAHVGEVGTYYGAPDASELGLRFADGSRLRLEPRTGLRVVRANVVEAIVSLEKGTAEIDVVPHPGRTWRVAAGPYTIRVTGTRFAASWDAAQLVVQMHEGEVIVTGPGIASGVTVQGMDRFATPASSADDAPVRGVSTDGRRIESGPSSPEVAVEAPPAAQGNLAHPAARPSPLLQPLAPAPLVTWAQLSARGDYDAILDAAEARGIDEALRDAAAEDLSALGDAARFRGRSALARRALNGLWTRFPGTPRAASAAFMLGRLEDDAGNRAEAAGWYSRTLSIGGPLSGEALGRKMIAERDLGRTAEARATAARYLEAVPQGPYAPHARALVP